MLAKRMAVDEELSSDEICTENVRKNRERTRLSVDRLVRKDCRSRCKRVRFPSSPGFLEKLLLYLEQGSTVCFLGNLQAAGRTHRQDRLSSHASCSAPCSIRTTCNPCAIKRTGCKTTPAVRRAAIPLIYKLYIIVKRQQVTPQTSFGNYSGPYIMSGSQNVRGLPLGQGRYLRVPFVWLRLVLLTDTSHWERY